MIPTTHRGGPADRQVFEVPACWESWHHRGGQYVRVTRTFAVYLPTLTFTRSTEEADANAR